MRFAPFLILSLLPACASSPGPSATRPADFAVEYIWESATPLPNNNSYQIQIAPDGAGSLVATTAFGEGPTKTWTFRLSDADLDTLYQALLSGKAFDRWVDKDDNTPVGGGNWWAEVHAGGKTVRILQHVALSDIERKSALGAVFRNTVSADTWVQHRIWWARARPADE